MQVRVCVLSILLLSFIPLHADEAKDLQKNLQRRYLKHVLVIRNFYGGDHLTFDAQGNLLGGAEPDCWCAAQIEVQKLEIKKAELILRGSRVVGFYNTQKKAFTSLQRQSAELEIVIKLDQAQMSQQKILGALEKIFLTTNDDLASLVPKPEPPKAVNLAAEGAMNTGGNAPPMPTTLAQTGKQGVTAPAAISSPDPAYTDEARKKKREGDVVLWVVVDPQGQPREIMVVKCLGAGLDEAAAETVSHWKFAPARKDGQPVAVQLNVDVSFHLY